jgi:hypothetical protein
VQFYALVYGVWCLRGFEARWDLMASVSHVLCVWEATPGLWCGSISMMFFEGCESAYQQCILTEMPAILL